MLESEAARFAATFLGMHADEGIEQNPAALCGASR